MQRWHCPICCSHKSFVIKYELYIHCLFAFAVSLHFSAVRRDENLSELGTFRVMKTTVSFTFLIMFQGYSCNCKSSLPSLPERLLEITRTVPLLQSVQCILMYSLDAGFQWDKNLLIGLHVITQQSCSNQSFTLCIIH